MRHRVQTPRGSGGAHGVGDYRRACGVGEAPGQSDDEARHHRRKGTHQPAGACACLFRVCHTICAMRAARVVALLLGLSATARGSEAQQGESVTGQLQLASDDVLQELEGIESEMERREGILRAVQKEMAAHLCRHSCKVAAKATVARAKGELDDVINGWGSLEDWLTGTEGSELDTPEKGKLEIGWVQMKASVWYRTTCWACCDRHREDMVTWVHRDTGAPYRRLDTGACAARKMATALRRPR